MSETVAFEARATRRLSVALVAGGALYAVLPAHPLLPCPLRTLTGIPCPVCGMTRAVTALMRGDVWASLRFQPAGIVLVAVALFMIVRLRRRAELLRVPTWLIMASLGLMWVWNLTLNPTFH